MTITFEHAGQFHIPCQHERGSGSVYQNTHSDYHPLTADEIKGLAAFALAAETIADYSQAVIRLCQGIPGMECPRPADGEVAELVTWVERFMAEMAQGKGYTPMSVLVRVLAPKGVAQAGEGTRDYRELRATLVDLTEEWSSTGAGMANSPYDAGVLETYTAAARRLRRILADRGNAIGQGEEATP